MEYIKREKTSFCKARIWVKFSCEEMLAESVNGKVSRILSQFSSSPSTGASKIWYSVDKENSAKIYSWDFSDDVAFRNAVDYLGSVEAILVTSREETLSFFDQFCLDP